MENPAHYPKTILERWAARHARSSNVVGEAATAIIVVALFMTSAAFRDNWFLVGVGTGSIAGVAIYSSLLAGYQRLLNGTGARGSDDATERQLTNAGRV